MGVTAAGASSSSVDPKKKPLSKEEAKRASMFSLLLISLYDQMTSILTRRSY